MCNKLLHYHGNRLLQYCQEDFTDWIDIMSEEKGLVGLKLLRKQRHLNQQKIAIDLNISRETISYYENGKRNPDIQMLKLLSNYFNVSIDYLINGKEFEKR